MNFASGLVCRQRFSHNGVSISPSSSFTFPSQRRFSTVGVFRVGKVGRTGGDGPARAVRAARRTLPVAASCRSRRERWSVPRGGRSLSPPPADRGVSAGPCRAARVGARPATRGAAGSPLMACRRPAQSAAELMLFPSAPRHFGHVPRETAAAARYSRTPDGARGCVPFGQAGGDFF